MVFLQKNFAMSIFQVQKQFSRSFLNSIIQNHVKKNVKIVSADVSHVTLPGENYVCALFRIIINYLEDNGELTSLRVIAKSLPDDEIVLALDQASGFHDRELCIYRNILPIMEQLGFTKKVAPKSYHIFEEPKKILILEDLKPLSYVLANRLDGLNLKHCMLAVEKLAYFHASSLAIHEKNPEIMEQYNEGLFKKNTGVEPMIEIVFKETVTICNTTPSLQKYSNKINNDRLKEKIFTITDRHPNFNVLNHGDFWTSNMMFQYNSDGSLADVLFVDFQFSVFASPFYDLHYFFVTSADLEVKEKFIKTVLNHYYDSLSKNVILMQIKSDIPKYEDFCNSFRNTAYMGFGPISFTLPFIKAPERSDANMINFMKNTGKGTFRHDCFNNNDYIRNLHSTLQLYDSLGMFD